MRTIHSKGKLFLYGMGAMGVNMLNLVIGSYLCDALMVEGFDKNIEMWTFSQKTLVAAAVWSVMITLAKIIDGVIDIPLAAFSDNLKSRWGRRRPAILIGAVPMVLAYVAFLNPISSAEHSIANTIWCGIALCLFYTFYTLTMGTYYATFAEIVDNDRDRVLLSNFKTVFDIVYFLLGYGLIPLMVSSSINIRTIGYIFLPLVLTILIPIFMIKEPSSLPKDVAKAGAAQPDVPAEEHVGMVRSFKYCMKNRGFVLWMLVYAILQFGLQMFITGQNVYYSGTLKLEGWQMTVLMAAVFVPVPLTLLLYNKIVKKRGITTGFRYSLITFMIAMVFMTLGSASIIGSTMPRLITAVVGCLIASLGIGCFFSISYTIPSMLADMDLKHNGVSHPTMFFALQGLSSGIATAISTGLVWVNLKDAGFSWLLPIVVLVALGVGLALSFILPKEFDQVGREGYQAS